MDSDSQKIIEAIERFRAGSAEAFSDIYEGAYRLVYSACFGILKNEEDARDVAQDVFVRIYEKIDTLNNPVAYGKWMKQIASNMSMDHIRRGSHTCNIEDDADLDLMAADWEQFDTLPDSFIEEEEKREIIDKVLRESLSEVQYQTIFMYYFSEMPLASIAESMECPEGTVKTRLMHAKEKFRKSLEKYVDDNKLVLAATPFLTRFFNASSPRVNIPDIASLGIPGLAAPSGAGTAAGAAAGSGTGTAAGVAAKAGFLSTIAGKIAVGAIALTLIGTATVIAVNLAKKDKPEETGAAVTTASDTSGSGADASGSGTDGAGGTDPVQPSQEQQATWTRNGNYVTFGRYEQDGDEANGLEPIEWEVIAEEDGKMLLLSKYVLDRHPYHTDNTDVTWETCDLRRWLNDEFLNTAFNAGEQQSIILTDLSNPVSPGRDVPIESNDTQDKIFCLSVDEVMKYFDFDKWHEDTRGELQYEWGYSHELIAGPTAYSSRLIADYEISAEDIAGTNYSEDIIGMHGSFWWLRSLCHESLNVCDVTYQGGAGWSQWNHQCGKKGVRPAMWVVSTGSVSADSGTGVRVFDSPASTAVTNDGSDYDFKIPMVTIEGVNTDEANKAIEKEISQYLYGEYRTELMSRYVYFMNDKIVSIIVYNEYTWFDDDWKTTVFNIDLKTGKLLDDGEVIKLCGLTDKEFFAEVKTIYEAYNKEGITEYRDYPNVRSFFNQNIKRVSFKYTDPYIGPDGHLCFAGYVNYIGGGGGAPVLFDTVTGTWHF